MRQRQSWLSVIVCALALTVGADKDAAIANRAVQSLGFKTNFTLVDQSVMYQKYCGDPQAKIDVCPVVGWNRDWSDPQTILDPAFAG